MGRHRGRPSLNERMPLGRVAAAPNSVTAVSEIDRNNHLSSIRIERRTISNLLFRSATSASNRESDLKTSQIGFSSPRGTCNSVRWAK